MKKWKKLLSIILSAAMVLGSQSIAAVGVAADTSPITAIKITPAGNTYNVASAGNLQWIADQVNGGTDFNGKTIVLTGNIDLGGAEWTPIGVGHFPNAQISDPKRAFKGTFNGNNYTISNFTVSQTAAEKGLSYTANGKAPNTNDYDYNLKNDYHSKGLFGYVDGGTVENLIINHATVQGWNAEAAVVGAMGAGTISHVSVLNSTIGGMFENAGAVVGLQIGAGFTMENCNAGNCDISIPTDYECQNGAGALIGRTQNGSPVISNNQISSCRISAYRKAAGLIGYMLQPTAVTMQENNITDTTVTISATIPKNKAGTDPYSGILFAEIQGGNSNRCYETAGSFTPFSYLKSASPGDCGTLTIPKPGDNSFDININANILTINKFRQSDAPEAQLAPSGEQYSSLQFALASAKDGDTVTLLKDIVLDSTLRVDKKITLDLNSHSITGTKCLLSLSADTEIKNGTLEKKTSANDNGNSSIIVMAATVTVDKDVTIKGSTAVMMGLGTPGKNSVLNFYGKAVGTKKQKANGDYSGGIGIGSNGATSNYSVINVYPGAEVSAERGKSASVNVADAPAIYAPSDNAKINIYGGTFTGDECICAKRGDIHIEGGTFTANGVYADPADAYNNGSEATGAAVSLVTNSRYPGGMTLVISGGLFSSANGYAVYEGADNASTVSNATAISIKDGYFKSLTRSSDLMINAAGLKKAVSGGCFGHDVAAEYLADGYKATYGTWTDSAGNGYLYKVTAVPVNKITDVAAAAYKDTAKDTANEVTAALSGNVITVSGKIASDDTKVVLTYTTADGNKKEITIPYTNSAFVKPADITEGGNTYSVDIKDLSIMPASVTTAAPAAADVPTPTGASDQQTASAAASAINGNKDELKAEGLGAAAADSVKTTGSGENKETTVPVGNANGTAVPTSVESVLDTAIKTEGAPSAFTEAGTELVVVVQPVIEIKVTDAITDTNTGKKTLVLDVSASTQTIVTTKENADSPNPAYTAGNSVTVGNPAPLVVNNDVALTIPVPDSFVNDDNKETIFIQHTKHDQTVETVKAYPGEEKYESSFYKTENFKVHGLSPIIMVTDSRTGTVDYQKADGSTLTTVKYTPADINSTQLPTTTAPAGQYQTGWEINDTTYSSGVFTDAMLDAINRRTVTATPVFASSGSTVAEHKVSFNANGGKGTMDAVTASDGAVSLPEAAFTNDGYKFIGWNTAKDGTGTPYTNGESITGLIADITLYAQWAKSPKTDGKLLAFSGDNRYETMKMLVSQDEYQIGGTAILTTGANYADALAAAGLAGLKEAPIILTNPGSLCAQARSMLQMTLPKTVYILGKTDAVSADAENAVRKLLPTAKIVREDGANRFATALKIYAAGSGWGKQAIIIDGQNYADALSAAPYAYAAKCPVFLSGEKTGLSKDAVAAIKAGGFNSAVIMGSSKAVPASVEKQLAGISVLRFSGSDRYDTCSKFATWATGGTKEKIQPVTKLTYVQPSVTTGLNFADGLAGAAYCGNRMSVLLLASDKNMTCITSNLAANRAEVKEVSVFGSTDAVSEKVRAAIKKAIG